MSHIAAARTRAEATLGSVCDISAPGGGPVTIDDDTGAATRSAGATVHADLPCSVAPVGTDTTNPDLGGQQLAGQRYRVAVPVSATGVQRGHTLTLTAVDDDGDPDLVGVPLTVDEVVVRSKVVLRRLICVDTRGTPGRVPG